MGKLMKQQLEQHLLELDTLAQDTLRKAIGIWQDASNSDISYRELDAINQLACACRTYKGMRKRG